MTEGNIRRKMLGFALPILAGYFFQQLYNTVDALIVGNYLDADALAAVTSTGSITYLMVGFTAGFATGAGIIVARHIGAENPEETGKAVHTAVALGLLFSVALTAIGILATPGILRLMGTPDTVFDRSRRYLQAYFAGVSALIMYNMFVSILQASGESRYPLLCLVASSLTNIVLDIVFISVFHMDVEGAAVATVISEILSMALVGARLLRSKESIRLRPRKIRMESRNLRFIIRYGFPTAMQGCVIDLSNMLIQSYINSFGRDAMAGIGASQKAEGFMFLPVTAFSMALTTFVSQNVHGIEDFCLAECRGKEDGPGPGGHPVRPAVHSGAAPGFRNGGFFPGIKTDLPVQQRSGDYPLRHGTDDCMRIFLLPVRIFPYGFRCHARPWEAHDSHACDADLLVCGPGPGAVYTGAGGA